MDQGVAVEEEGMVGAAEEAGKLVEQARADADELIFGPPQCLGQLHAKQVVLMAVEVAAGSAGKKAELDQEPGDGSLKARRAREAGPERNIAGDRRLEARREGPAPFGQGPADAADIPRPGPGLGLFDLVERKVVGLAEIDRDDRRLSACRTTADNHGRPIDRRGHDQTAVVVGVVAQQLDPAGSTAHDGRFAAEPRGESRAGLRQKLSVVRGPWSVVGATAASPPSVVLFECRVISRRRSSRDANNGQLTTDH